MSKIPYAYRIIGGDLNCDMTGNSHRAVTLRNLA